LVILYAITAGANIANTAAYIAYTGIFTLPAYQLIREVIIAPNNIA
jgi:hypothetical protein